MFVAHEPVVEVVFYSADDWESASWEAVDQFQDVVQEHTTEQWPMCRAHTSPYELETRDGMLVWWCPAGSHQTLVGSLHAST